ncbi:RNA polymerase sigma factor [Nocardia sp. XZ_19_369]|uniref:RNA polymerase sigma factor n=1 Tax=Nocardia sp. XZ_19_369 TaxID=2769487 RepID=UPI00188FA694|nr:sigma-70 family RNA polymerase sigma factor [Nocardia sp. XZ_19_369]
MRKQKPRRRLTLAQADLLEVVYRAHHQRLYRYLLAAAGGDGRHAEDWTKEAFLAVIEKYGLKLRGMAPPVVGAILKATATNLAKDYWRRGAGPVQLVPDAADVEIDDGVEALLSAIMIERFWKAASTVLDPITEYPTAFMSWGMDLTAPEIAAVLATTATTIRNKRQAIRHKLIAAGTDREIRTTDGPPTGSTDSPVAERGEKTQ